jgi:hypothetical protein
MLDYRQQAPKLYEYDFATRRNLVDHLRSIYRLFFGPEDNQLYTKFCLQLEVNKQYLIPDQEAYQEGTSFLAEKVEDIPQSSLVFFKMIPSLRVQKTLELLKNALSSNDVAQLKTIAFGLRTFLRVSYVKKLSNE